MDLVVSTGFGVFYLDVTVYHPFTRLGARRLPSAGGSLAAQEQKKRERYVVRDPASGTTCPFAINALGDVCGS